jgi:hypothetical protein
MIDFGFLNLLALDFSIDLWQVSVRQNSTFADSLLKICRETPLPIVNVALNHKYKD